MSKYVNDLWIATRPAGARDDDLGRILATESLLYT